MAKTKYHGKRTVALYKEVFSGNPTVDLSGTSRTVELDEQGQEIDVSTRDDYMEDATQYLTNPPARAVTLAGLDTTPHSGRAWKTIDIGDEGRIAIYPFGSSPSGLPYDIMDVVCTASKYSSPHDNAATWNVGWRVSGPKTPGTT